MMKKTKFTVIDALIILFVIAALAVVAIKLKPGMLNKAEQKDVNFSVLVSEADEGVADIIKTGENVSISFSEQAYATVTNVEEQPTISSTFSPNAGKYVSHEIKGKKNIKIDLTCPADISDTHIKNDQVPIRVGAEMPVRGKGYVVKGYVIEVND